MEKFLLHAIHVHLYMYVYGAGREREWEREWERAENLAEIPTHISLKWIPEISVLSLLCVYFFTVGARDFECLYHWNNLNRNRYKIQVTIWNDGTKVTHVAFLCLYIIIALSLFTLNQLFNVRICSASSNVRMFFFFFEFAVYS